MASCVAFCGQQLQQLCSKTEVPVYLVLVAERVTIPPGFLAFSLMTTSLFKVWLDFMPLPCLEVLLLLPSISFYVANELTTGLNTRFTRALWLRKTNQCNAGTDACNL